MFCQVEKGGNIPEGENSMTQSSEVRSFPQRSSTVRSSRMNESKAWILESEYLGWHPGSVTF